MTEGKMDIVERLRMAAPTLPSVGPQVMPPPPFGADQLSMEAADEITRLRAEVERLLAELSSGSFYKESDIDAIQNRAATAEEENERLREALLNIADMPANPAYDWYELVEEMASTARRAALKAQEFDKGER